MNVPHPGRRGVLLLSLLLATLLLPGALVAKEVLLYGPGVPSAELAAKAELIQRVVSPPGAENDPPADSAGTAHIVDLPFPAAAPIWMAGDLLELPCADDELASVDPIGLLATGQRQVDDLDYDSALLTLTRAIKALPCTEVTVSRDTLSGIYFFRGLAFLQKGNERKARRAWAAALGTDIDYPWNLNYPPEGQQLFLEVAKEVVTRGKHTVGVDLRGSGLSSLSVDGRPVPIEQPRDIELSRGRHFVRYEDANGAFVGRLVDVSGDGVFVTREALQVAVLGLAWGGNSALAARQALKDLARNRGAETVLVVTLADGGQAARAFRFAPTDGSIIPLAVEAQALSQAKRASRGTRKTGSTTDGGGDGRLGVVLQGGLQAAPGQSGAYALLSLRLDLRLVGGLELGTGLYMGMRSFSDPADEQNYLILLPMIPLQLRYRLPSGLVHPWGGVRGLLGFGHDGSGGTLAARPLGGVLGVGGVEITPTGPRGLLLGIDAGVGYLDGFAFTLSAGAGLRF